MIHAITDTHALIWYLSDEPLLSKQADLQFDKAIENKAFIGVSAISVVEIVYLVEKSRVVPETLIRLENELSEEFPLLEIIPLTYQIAREMSNIPYSQVPDMPDRIIAATALYYNVPLISRDRKIILDNVRTIW
jgi:PIN domain nuclease of toxin-antitoxin system